MDCIIFAVILNATCFCGQVAGGGDAGLKHTDRSLIHATFQASWVSTHYPQKIGVEIVLLLLQCNG